MSVELQSRASSEMSVPSQHFLLECAFTYPISDSAPVTYLHLSNHGSSSAMVFLLGTLSDIDMLQLVSRYRLVHFEAKARRGASALKAAREVRVADWYWSVKMGRAWGRSA